MATRSLAVDAIIAAGATVSSPISDLSIICQNFSVIIPTTTNANLTVQVSEDGVNYFDLVGPNSGASLSLARGKAHTFQQGGFMFTRFTGVNPEAAQRVIKVFGF